MELPTPGVCTGYAMSSEAELKAVVDTSQATGIIFDPVYSGALHRLSCQPALTPVS